MKLDVTPLGYRAVRLRWCAAALRGLLRRWGVHVAVVLAVLGSGASAGVNGVAGLLGITVMPLIQTLDRPVGAALLLTVLHSLVGAVLVFATRPILWSKSWARAEAALPIDPRELRRSDWAVVAVTLLPLALVYAGGGVSWAGSLPARALTGASARLLGCLALSLALSFAGGVAILGATRRLADGRGAAYRPAKAGRPRHSGVVGSLLLLPMTRGPARRVLSLAAMGMVAQCAPAALLLTWPAAASWGLALHAVLGMVFSSRLSAVAEADLRPLHEACAPLPIAPARTTCLRRLVCHLPLAAGMVALGAALAWGQLPKAVPWVLTAFLLGHLGLNSLQLMLAADRARIRNATWGACWLFALVVLVALAFEAF